MGVTNIAIIYTSTGQHLPTPIQGQTFPIAGLLVGVEPHSESDIWHDGCWMEHKVYFSDLTGLPLCYEPGNHWPWQHDRTALILK